MSTPAVLITGGTSGIGKVTAELLHELGYQVMVTGQNPDTIAAARSELPEDVVVFQADSRSVSDIDCVAAAYLSSTRRPWPTRRSADHAMIMS